MCLNLYPLPLALPLTITEKSLVNSPLLLHLLYVHLLYVYKVPLSPLFFKLNSLSFLSLSLHVRCSNPSTIFLSVCWTHSSMPMALLYWGAQSWTQYSLIPTGFWNLLWKHNNWPNFYDQIYIFFNDIPCSVCKLSWDSYSLLLALLLDSFSNSFLSLVLRANSDTTK